jgi:hypothetical protein
MTAIDKLFGSTPLSATRADTIRKTYMLLGLAVAGGFCGGYLGAQSDTLADLFTGWLGWILAMVLLNVIPRIAMAARHNPVLGVTALLADGFISGIVLAPILRLASRYSPGTTEIAMLMTLVVFGAVTVRDGIGPDVFGAAWIDAGDLGERHRRHGAERVSQHRSAGDADCRGNRHSGRVHPGVRHQRGAQQSSRR